MKKLVFLNLIFILMINLLLPSNCLAITQDQEHSIASFAERLVSSNYNIFYDNEANKELYAGFSGSIFFNEKEYVNYVYKNVFPFLFNAEDPIPTDTLHEFIDNGEYEKNFKKISSENEIQPGDIIIRLGDTVEDAAICVEKNGDICNVVSAKASVSRKQQIQIRSYKRIPSQTDPDLYFYDSYKTPIILRLKDDINISSVNNVITGVSYYAETAQDTITYQGLPIEYSVNAHKPVLKKIIDALVDFFSNIQGTLVKGFQIFVLSILGVIEKILSILKGDFNLEEATLSFTYLVTNLKANEFPTGAGLNFVDIIFNKVPILDVNFIDIYNAGGQSLTEGGYIYIIRENVAGWYYTIRNISIAAMTIVLIYTAIRIAISVIPEQGAKYKKNLVDWGFSFGILIFLHYIMMAILYLNSSLLNVIYDNAPMAIDSFSEIATTAQSPSIIDSLMAMVVFIAILYTTIRFLIIYFKRMFKIIILTIFSPLMVISYAIERIKGDSGANLNRWLKVYAFNVFVQLLHAIVYCTFIVAGFEIMRQNAIAGTIVVIALLSYIYGLEEILKNVFGISDVGSEDQAGFVKKILDKIKK